MQIAAAQAETFVKWRERDKAEAVIRKVLQVLPDADELRKITASEKPGK
jgi:hypothetical protein